MSIKRCLSRMGVLFLILTALPASAADHRNLEENHPTRIEDAYPIPYRSREIQARAGFDKNGEFGENVGTVETEFKWGFMKNAHLVLGLPLLFGDEVEPDQNGDVRVEGLYNFNVETVTLPAFGFKTDLLLPFGTDSAGVDVELVGIATKGWGQNRFHLNTIYRRNSGAERGERDDLYRVGLAFDRPIDLDHLFTADFFVDQAVERGDDPIYSFVIGGRKQINPWSVLTFGVGHGFGGKDAPDFIATLGFQVNY